jgi:CMP-N-acetylneuraminic acid synthetase
VEQKENGYYGKVKELNVPILSRQTAPKVYDMNASFYIYRRFFLILHTVGQLQINH